MRPSLFSPLWYRVSDQVPKIAPGVTVHPQPSRGHRWYVMVSAASGQQSRLNHSAYQLVGRFDGHHTVQQIWDQLLHELQDDAPTQDEVIRILAQLSEQGLLDYGYGPDVDVQSKRRLRRESTRRRSQLNPLAFQVPLGDPSAVLRRLDGVARGLLQPRVFWLWVLCVGMGVVTALSNWTLLSAHTTATVGTTRFLLLAWLVFPGVKLLHELGHGMAVRHWGGEVREAGISLLLLTPAPYVNASASAGFRKRSHRACVAAMGVMVELAVAVLALALWLNVQPGWVRDVAFAVMFVAGVSTVLYNANPLLKFDGYFVLCDGLDLPNLAPRSQQYWINLLQRGVFGSSLVQAFEAAPGERKWLLGYAPLSTLYRLVLSGVMVLWVAHFSALLATVLALYVVAMVVIWPALKTARLVLAAAPLGVLGARARLMLLTGGFGALLVCLVAPFPYLTSAWGVVWLPEHAHVTVGTDGFVRRFAARDGEQVQRGQLLLVLDDPELVAKRTALTSELAQLQSENFEVLMRDSLKASNVQTEIERMQGALRHVEDRLAQLELRSQVDGMLVMPKQDDTLGSFLKRGQTVGYVLDRSEIGVRVAVPESDAALVRQGLRSVSVRMADSVQEVRAAVVIRDVPASGFELPSAALGDKGGGPYVTDGAQGGLRSVQPVVLIDLYLPQRTVSRVGGRVFVRFDHGSQPLATQAYRRLSQLFLQHFSPGT